MAQITGNQLIEELAPYREAIQNHLDQLSQPAPGCPHRLSEAIRYSLLTPGKRLRPLLVLLACEACSGQWRTALSAACAMEMVHVYSLIHDDLPAMDDDDLRRGHPTCHRQFDEATAILAGDSLQMLAFQVLCENYEELVAAKCCRILAEAAGRCNLVGGQADDLAAEGRYGSENQHQDQPLEFLKAIHRRKTGALIVASLQLGGVVGGGTLEHLEKLSEYGHSIGLAFQIVDDCLDVESTVEVMGKRTGKDHESGKLTYPGLLGLEGSRQLANQRIQQACEAIDILGERSQRLKALARFVVERSN